MLNCWNERLSLRGSVAHSGICDRSSLLNATAGRVSTSGGASILALLEEELSKNLLLNSKSVSNDHPSVRASSQWNGIHRPPAPMEHVVTSRGCFGDTMLTLMCRRSSSIAVLKPITPEPTTSTFDAMMNSCIKWGHCGWDVLIHCSLTQLSTTPIWKESTYTLRVTTNQSHSI